MILRGEEEGVIRKRRCLLRTTQPTGQGGTSGSCHHAVAVLKWPSPGAVCSVGCWLREATVVECVPNVARQPTSCPQGTVLWESGCEGPWRLLVGAKPGPLTCVEEFP